MRWDNKVYPTKGCYIGANDLPRSYLDYKIYRGNII